MCLPPTPPAPQEATQEAGGPEPTSSQELPATRMARAASGLAPAPREGLSVLFLVLPSKPPNAMDGVVLPPEMRKSGYMAPLAVWPATGGARSPNASGVTFPLFRSQLERRSLPLSLPLCRPLCSPGGRTPRLGAGGTEVLLPSSSVGRTVGRPPSEPWIKGPS